MRLDELKELLPEEAKDLRVNLGNIARDTSLNEQQLWGAVLASALASRNPTVIRVAAAEAAAHLTPAAIRAAKIAAQIMAMNNVYYRFTHLVSNAEYQHQPSRLRMQALGDPGVDKLDLELWSLAVSAINGCGRCMDAHEQKVRKEGADAKQVQDVVRVAAVVTAVAVTLDGVRALAHEDDRFTAERTL
jgi:alkyl hydroperoxide reductase subunit D